MLPLPSRRPSVAKAAVGIRRHAIRVTIMTSAVLQWGLLHTAPSLSMAGAATSIIFVATNTCFILSPEDIFVATELLLRHNFCRDKYKTRVCRDKSFVAYKHTFVATKDVFCCDKKWYLSQLQPLTATSTLTQLRRPAATDDDEVLLNVLRCQLTY